MESTNIVSRSDMVRDIIARAKEHGTAFAEKDIVIKVILEDDSEVDFKGVKFIIHTGD